MILDPRFFFIRSESTTYFRRVIHMDEKTPHLHYCFTPITAGNCRLCKNRTRGTEGLIDNIWRKKMTMARTYRSMRLKPSPVVCFPRYRNSLSARKASDSLSNGKRKRRKRGINDSKRLRAKLTQVFCYHRKKCERVTNFFYWLKVRIFFV